MKWASHLFWKTITAIFLVLKLPNATMFHSLSTSNRKTFIRWGVNILEAPPWSWNQISTVIDHYLLQENRHILKVNAIFFWLNQYAMPIIYNCI
jgi:hypothetical protein